MKISITVEDLSEKVNMLRSISQDSDDKLSYSIKKTLLQTDKVFEGLKTEIRNEVEDAQIMNASVDSENNLIKDDRGQYKYTRENAIALNKIIRDLNEEFNSKIITVEVHQISLSNVGVDRLNDNQIEALTGFLITEESILIV